MRMPFRWSFALALGLSLTGSPAVFAPGAARAADQAAPPARATAPRSAAEISRAIDAFTRPLVARGDLSGQLLIARHGAILLERNYGFASPELQVPVTPDTRFNIASVTKPMTVVLTIQLITEHKLALRDSIARWLPGFPSGDSITVTQLLRHRSGIAHEVIPDSEMTRPFTAAEVVERARRLPLDFRPGTRESYSSGGFSVLARILELVSGQSYGALLAARIFGPVGMTHSSNADSRTLLPGRAVATVPGARGPENAPLEDFSALVGAGSVWSTARDLHRFVQAVVTGKLGSGPQQSYLRDGRLDFNGRTGGFKAWAVFDSASGNEAVFLGNLATGAPDALKEAVMRLIAGEPVPPPALPELADGAPSEAELRRWEGAFRLENGIHLDFHVRDGALYSNDWVMRPTRDGAMFSPRDYGLVRRIAAPDGSTLRIDWVQNGVTYPATRAGAEAGKP